MSDGDGGRIEINHETYDPSQPAHRLLNVVAELQQDFGIQGDYEVYLPDTAFDTFVVPLLGREVQEDDDHVRVESGITSITVYKGSKARRTRPVFGQRGPLAQA